MQADLGALSSFVPVQFNFESSRETSTVYVLETAQVLYTRFLVHPGSLEPFNELRITGSPTRMIITLALSNETFGVRTRETNTTMIRP